MAALDVDSSQSDFLQPASGAQDQVWNPPVGLSLPRRCLAGCCGVLVKFTRFKNRGKVEHFLWAFALYGHPLSYPFKPAHCGSDRLATVALPALPAVIPGHPHDRGGPLHREKPPPLPRLSHILHSSTIPPGAVACTDLANRKKLFVSFCHLLSAFEVIVNIDNLFCLFWQTHSRWKALMFDIKKTTELKSWMTPLKIKVGMKWKFPHLFLKFLL